MPLFYANYQAKDTPAKIAAVFRVFVLFALCIFIVLSVFAKEILRIFTTPGYYGASLIIPFLIPAVLLSGMYIFAPGLGLAKKTKHIALINISIAIANTSLNFILIPFIGISGAAMATLFSNLGGFALYIILGNKYYRIDFEWRIIWLAIVITIVIVALGGNISFLSNSLHYLLKAILVILNICIIGNLLIKRKELNQVAFLVRSKINIPAKGIT
jgi:O-antigen/teichoic acid export membrane protein